MMKQFRVWAVCLAFFSQTLAQATPAATTSTPVSPLNAIFETFAGFETYQEFASYLVLEATPTDEAFFTKYFKAATGAFPKITHNGNTFSIEGLKGEITVSENMPITFTVGSKAWTFNPETSVEENVTRAEAWISQFSGTKTSKAQLLIPSAHAQVLESILLIGGIIYAVSAAYYAYKCAKIEQPHTAKEWGMCGLKGLVQPLKNIASTFRMFGNSALACRPIFDRVVCPQETDRKSLTITHRCPGGLREKNTIYYNAQGKPEKIVVKVNSVKYPEQYHETGRLAIDSNSSDFRITAATPAKGSSIKNPDPEYLAKMSSSFAAVDSSCRTPSWPKRVENNVEHFFQKMLHSDETPEQRHKRQEQEERSYQR